MLLASADDANVTVDPYWTNVTFLMRGDTDINTYGLPVYRDFSKYQYKVRQMDGTANDSLIQTRPYNDSAYPVFPTDGNNIQVSSYLHINNKSNQFLRIAEINSGDTTLLGISKTYPTYLDILQEGNPYHVDLGSGNFTFEFSFFAEEVNLPYRYQSIISCPGTFTNSFFSPSTPAGIKTYISPWTGTYDCWTIVLDNSDLVFFARGNPFKVNSTAITKNTWYHVCIQRVGNQLWTYINGTRTNVYTYNITLTNTYSNADWTVQYRLCIGSERGVRAAGFGTTGPITDYNRIDTSFSGGISNIRLTKGIARYNASFYTVKLPFPVSLTQNKIDTFYNDVLFNYPGEYDLYDYSKYFAHPVSTQQRRKVFSYDHGFLLLQDGTEYISKNISVNLSNTEWTIEFYIAPTFNNAILPRGMAFPNARELVEPQTGNTYASLLSNYSSNTYITSEVELPLLSLVSNNNKFIDISQRIIPGNNAYMGLRLSSNGTSWINVASEAGITWGGTALPNDTIKFNATGFSTLPAGLTATTGVRYLGYDEPFQHYVIQRLNNVIYFFINGSLHRSISFSNTLYGEDKNNLELHIGGYRGAAFGRVPVSTNIPSPNPANFQTGQVAPLDFAIKGIKVTNKAKYPTTGTIAYMNSHSIHPLPLELNVTPPPRARVLAISRKINNITISNSQAEWYVYWSQPIQTLTLADFTITQSDGLTGASLTSLTKLNEYQYVVKADTGSATGRLTLNFIDRKTLFYKGTSNFISNAIGELNFEGDYYIINKQPPVPILSSGSNPYVNGPFQVTLTFQGAIANFYSEKIGLVNCKITNIIQTDDVNVTYQLTITPINQDVVIIQCLEGVAQTETGINSAISQPLTRIYSTNFPILQTPLNLTTTRNDLSPNRLVLQEVISNNTVFDNTRFPVGETASLRVIPTSEQSGLRYLNFNAVSSILSNVNSTDWTIEFFLRINGQQSGTTNFSHILSVENASTGFSIVSVGTSLRIRRTVASGAELFTSLSTSWRNLGRANNTTFPQWTDNTFTQQEKFPHFAITKQGTTYRFYVNGSRVALFSSPTTVIDITKGDIYIGYYPARVTDIDYNLSNVRLTLGSALYTAATVNIPALPYTVSPNILDSTELFNYISIYSNNTNANRATLNNEVKLKFTSIFNLQSTPVVTILGKSVAPIEGDNNTYTASIFIQSSDPDGKIPFIIDVSSEPGMPSKTFTNTTNGSEVIVDKTPLSANISTTELNNNNYIIPCQILFTEPVTYMDLTSLTVTNCVLSNLLKVDNLTYTFTARCLNNGTFSIQLEANKVIDQAGNFNTSSNILSRTGAVPAYIPDPYWNNVLFCLQPTNNIIDESLSQIPITINNVVVDNAVAPNNIGASLYFNGQNSSLEFTLGETLSSGNDYTIEFFAYVKSSTVFRLGTPTIQPANNVTATTFQANWQSTPNASSYILDISTQSNFNTYLPGFKNLNVGNSTTYLVTTTKGIYVPALQTDMYLGSKGFVPKWKYPYDSIGYVYDVALDANFTKKLFLYSNKFTKNTYAVVGTLENLAYQSGSSSSSTTTSTDSYNLAKGVVITGLLSNNNYPKLYYFLEEETIRLYKNNKYAMPAIAEDVDSLTWLHIAIVNRTKYTYLYINGILQDKIRNTGFATDFDIGYDIGRFYGYITGLRITKGVARYTSDNFIIPTLPYPKN